MPAEYTIDVDDRLVHSRAWGVLTGEDLFAHRGRLLDDPQFQPEFDQVFDFTDVTDLQVTAAIIRGAAPNAPFAPTARRAFVVASDGAYGLARMYGLALGASDESYRIFWDRGEALAWLRPDSK